MDYTLYNILLSIVVSGIIVLALIKLLHAINNKNSNFSRFAISIKIVAFALLLIPVGISLAFVYIFPSFIPYYVSQVLIALAFVVSFLILEQIMLRVKFIQILIDGLAMTLINVFVLVSLWFYERLISKVYSKNTQNRFIHTLMRYDLQNRCAEIVKREFESFDLQQKVEVIDLGYKLSIEVSNADSTNEIFAALNAESMKIQRHQKSVPYDEFIVSLLYTIEPKTPNILLPVKVRE